MLLQFAVQNFPSFRERTVLSMVAAPQVTHDDRQVIQLPGLPPVLRMAVVYGANASGKSNLVKALRFAVRLVVDALVAP